jgi:VWFA-related protein
MVLLNPACACYIQYIPMSSRRSEGSLTRRSALTACVVAAALAVGWSGTVARLVAQTFRATVDLIAVDVHVADRNGQLLPDLGPEAFEVTLDGRKRRVVSATLTRHEVMPVAAPGLGPSEPGQDVPGPSTVLVSDRGASRNFIIAIDTASFRSLDIYPAVLAAQRFVSQLAPDDAVGVFTLPNGPNLPSTTSHAQVRQLLTRVAGTKPVTSGQFSMSVEQVVDVTALKSLSLIESRRAMAEMFNEESATGDQLVCPGIMTLCTEAALVEAETIAYQLEQDVLEGIARLDSLLRLLEEMPGRKTVLLLSGGMPVSDRGNGRPSVSTEVKQLGERATYANATIHALYFDQELNQAFAVDSRKPRAATGRTRGIYTRVLAEFSEPSGGTLRDVTTGAGEREIDQLVSQMSSYYVLGVEPDDRDRDGRPHRLGVKVGGRGVQIRSRQLVIVPRVVKQ